MGEVRLEVVSLSGPLTMVLYLPTCICPLPRCGLDGLKVASDSLHIQDIPIEVPRDNRDICILLGCGCARAFLSRDCAGIRYMSWELLVHVLGRLVQSQLLSWGNRWCQMLVGQGGNMLLD